MKSRISLLADPDGAERIPSAEEDYLRSLIEAGLVTHRITHPDNIDPMFAVSQIADLPDVAFVAAFQQGLLFLGCPNGPPDRLADMVEPVQQVIKDDVLNAADLLSKFDALNARLDALQPTSADHLSPALKQLELLSSRLDYLVDGLQPEDKSANDAYEMLTVQALIEDLHQKFDAAQAQDAPLAQIRASIDRIAQAAPQAPIVSEPNENTLQVTSEYLDQHFESLSATLAEVKTRINALTGQQSPDEIDRSALAQTLAALDTRFDRLLNQPEQNQLPKDILARLDAIQTAIDATDTRPDQIIDKTDRLAEQLSLLTDTQDACKAENPLEEEIKRVQETLAQLVEQEQTSTNLLEAHTTTLQNLAASDDVNAITAKLDSVLAEAALSEPIKLVPAQIEQLEKSIKSLNAKLPEMVSLSPIESQLSELQEQVRILAAEPNTAPEDDEQQLMLKQIAQELSSLVQSVDATSNKIDATIEGKPDAASVEELNEALAALSKTLTSNFAKLFDFTTIKNQLDGLVLKADNLPAPVDLTTVEEALAQVSTRAEGLSAEFSALRIDVMHQATLPAPTLDLTAQREGFARFGTAMKTVMGQLTDAIEKLNVAHARSEGEALEMTAAVQSLPVVLEKVLVEGLDLNPIEGALTDLRREVSQLPNQFEKLEPLHAAIDALARRPDPVIDLTEQRSSLARFATAMAGVVARLENVSMQLLEIRTEPVTTDPLAVEVAAIIESLKALGDNQSAQSEEISKQLSAVLEHIKMADAKPRDPAAIVADLTDRRISLDEIRVLFAELIAGQIKQNLI